MSSKVTFTVCDAKPIDRKIESISVPEFLSHRLNAGEKLVHNTTPTFGGSVTSIFSNGIVGAYHCAYSNHLPLILRPDDIWLAIALVFSNFVKDHAEDFRSEVIDFEGKIELEVENYTFDDISKWKWDLLVEDMANKIQNHLKRTISEWMVPQFTTTTPRDILIARVALMGAMREYFGYRFTTMCGIPSVTLMGTLEDWKLVRSKANEIGSYTKFPDLMKWHKVLMPVLDNFVASYEAVTLQFPLDSEFWNKGYNYLQMSGSETISGWILAFSPFKKGIYNLNDPAKIAETGCYGPVETSDIESALLVEFPVIIDDLQFIFSAGSTFITVNTGGVQPSYDWAIIKAGPSPVNKPELHQHPLVYFDKKPFPHWDANKCECCHQTITQGFSCRSIGCTFCVCPECLNANQVPPTLPEKIVSILHPCELKKTYRGSCFCDVCRDTIRGFSMHCAEHDYDMCKYCI